MTIKHVNIRLKYGTNERDNKGEKKNYIKKKEIKDNTALLDFAKYFYKIVSESTYRLLASVRCIHFIIHSHVLIEIGAQAECGDRRLENSVREINERDH